MSKENKKKTCPPSSNFAFAIIALLTAGLLLYTTVEVFNCKQDIAQINERIQNSPSFVSTHSEQKIEEWGKDESNENVDTKNTDENKEKIIYNKDSSIDTSNWKTYTNDNYGFTMKYPADENEIKIGEYEKDVEFEEGKVQDEIEFICKNDKYYSINFFTTKNKDYTIEQLVNNETKNGEFDTIGGMEKKYKKYKKMFLNNEKIDNPEFKTLKELEESFKKYREIKQIGDYKVYRYDFSGDLNPYYIYMAC